MFFLTQEKSGLFLHFFKLGYNGDFKDEEMGKIQILQLRHPDQTKNCQMIRLSIISMSISKLMSTVTLTINYSIELRSQRYEKVLNIHFDVARAYRFYFNSAKKCKPIEEHCFEGTKQNIFNYLQLKFNLGEIVMDL